jgi:hypothetical protein
MTVNIAEPNRSIIAWSRQVLQRVNLGDYHGAFIGHV